MTATVTATDNEHDWLRLTVDKGAMSSEQSAHDAADTARRALFESVMLFAERGTRLTMDHALLISATNRAFGLHDAIVREADNDNPHAALTLLRSLLDLVLVVLQVRRQPDYAAVVMDVTSEDRRAPGPLSAQKLLANAQAELPGMKDAWNDLSEIAHFGREGFVLTVDDVRHDDSGLHVSVSTESRWRIPADKLTTIVAAAVMTEVVAASIRKVLTDRPLGPPLTD